MPEYNVFEILHDPRDRPVDAQRLGDAKGHAIMVQASHPDAAVHASLLRLSPTTAPPGFRFLALTSRVQTKSPVAREQAQVRTRVHEFSIGIAHKSKSRRMRRPEVRLIRSDLVVTPVLDPDRAITEWVNRFKRQRQVIPPEGTEKCLVDAIADMEAHALCPNVLGPMAGSHSSDEDFYAATYHQMSYVPFLRWFTLEMLFHDASNSELKHANVCFGHELGVILKETKDDKRFTVSSTDVSNVRALQEYHCKKSMIVLFPVTIHVVASSRSYAHATLLLLRRQSLSDGKWNAEYIDSNGTLDESESVYGEFYETSKIALENALAQHPFTQDRVVFQQPNAMCPRIGPQSKSGLGDCANWAAMFAYLRVRCLDVLPRRLFGALTTFGRDSLRKLMRIWTCFQWAMAINSGLYDALVLRARLKGWGLLSLYPSTDGSTKQLATELEYTTDDITKAIQIQEIGSRQAAFSVISKHVTTFLSRSFITPIPPGKSISTVVELIGSHNTSEFIPNVPNVVVVIRRLFDKYHAVTRLMTDFDSQVADVILQSRGVIDKLHAIPVVALILLFVATASAPDLVPVKKMLNILTGQQLSFSDTLSIFQDAINRNN